MKKVLVALMMVLGLAFTASAAVKDFGAFSADVPDGWTANKDGSVVAFIAPNNAAAMSIAVDKADGIAPEALAKEFSKQLQGTAPQAIDGGYSFEFTRNGVKSTSILSVDSGEYVLITMTDPSGKFGDQFTAILDSVKEK